MEERDRKERTYQELAGQLLAAVFEEDLKAVAKWIEALEEDLRGRRASAAPPQEPDKEIQSYPAAWDRGLQKLETTVHHLVKAVHHLVKLVDSLHEEVKGAAGARRHLMKRLDAQEQRLRDMEEQVSIQAEQIRQAKRRRWWEVRFPA